MPAFNPNDHLIDLKGKKYLPVAARLAWLRETAPAASIRTELLERSDTFALFKAVVTMPDGGVATGHGSETKADFGDFLEKAETKAVGRAIAMLGYGTLHALELDEGHRIVDSPVAPRTPAPATPAVDPDTAAAREALALAMKVQGWSLPRVIETAGWVWPHIQTKADLGTLTTVQLARLTEVVTGESVIHLDTHGVRRIVPAAVAIGVA
jgi:hypothetical protein